MVEGWGDRLKELQLLSARGQLQHPANHRPGLPASDMQTIRTLAAADWGLALQRAARIAAPLVALVAVIIADLVVLTYRAGKATGLAVARRSDQLAGLFSRVLVPAGPAPMAAPLLTPTPAPVASPRALVLELEGLTQRQLMAMAGTRRKLSKRQLVDMVAAA